MKFGYSNLLGEHISAPAVRHKDCETFQIVCPACREPVFKGERGSNDTIIHYLSHYAADKSYQAECEMRVSKLSESVIEHDNRTSRDQRLEYFLKVLRDLISAEKIYVNGPARAQSILSKSKAISWLRQKQFEHMSRFRFSSSDFEEASAGYVSDITGVGGVLDTSFALGVQKRISYDIWCHLLTAKGRPNFEFLFNHGYMMVLTRVRAAMDVRPLGSEERMMFEGMSRLVEVSKPKGFNLIQRMAVTPVGPPFALEGMMLLGKAMTEVTHEMIGTLLGLPYFECLKRYEANKVI